jgi:CDP-glucose 4,6-dehydratase
MGTWGCALEGVDMSSFWRDRSVLVTGATGLVGGHVVRRLVMAKASVVALIRDDVPGNGLDRMGLRPEIQVVRGTIEDQTFLERVLGEYEVDTVLHLAAQTIVGIANRNPISTFESNIAGTWRVLEACRRSPKVRQIVLASSDKAYGDHDILPYNEEAPLKGQHPYDVSKSCADLIAQTYAHTWGTPVAITRCGNFFGAGDLNFNRIVPGTIRSILRGEAPIIRSDGKFIRDYFYVEDGAEAYLLLAQKLAENPGLRGRAYNFSYENQLSVTDIVSMIQARMGSQIAPIILNEASNEIRHQYLSAERARKELAWAPSFNMEEGLDRTIAWYRALLGTP